MVTLSPKAFDAETIQKHAEMLANRCLKNYKKLAPRFRKQKIEVFRIYDRDIPEVRAIVDWYAGHLVVSELVREQTIGIPYLEGLVDALQQKMQIPLEHIHQKKRQTRPEDGPRYQRLAKKEERLIVQEGELRFWVNLDDYLDTGLYPDHRITRARVQKECEGLDVLNLYCYTASFSAYAVKGGARRVTSVDISAKYLAWAKDNFSLNELPEQPHEFIASEVREFLNLAIRERRQWDLIILDPPSFSTDKQGYELLDIQRDHPELITACLAVLRPRGKLYFSTNHQMFRPQFTSANFSFEDLSQATTPEDFQNRQPHLLYCFQKQT